MTYIIQRNADFKYYIKCSAQSKEVKFRYLSTTFIKKQHDIHITFNINPKP